MSSNKKVLILGVGNAQVDAIRYCKKIGCEVYGISYKDEGRGRQYVDHFDVINVLDKDAVLAHASAISADIVYSVGSDIAMPTASYVSEKLGLPRFVSEKTAELLQNKGELRDFLKRNNLSPIHFSVARSLGELADWEHYPAILKPVDSQGQRGVIQVGSTSELADAFPRSVSFSRSGEIILEQFIDGPEVSVNAFVNDGEVIYSVITDRYVVENLPGGLVKGHGLPTELPGNTQDQIHTLVKRTIHALEISYGPVYFQLKCSEQGVFVIEVTPRLDGCHIWRLIALKYGIDLLDMSFRLLMDLDGSQRSSSPYLTSPLTALIPEKMQLDFFLQEPNTPCHITASVLTGEQYRERYYEEEEIIRPINGLMEKTGYRIFVVN